MVCPTLPFALWQSQGYAFLPIRDIGLSTGIGGLFPAFGPRPSGQGQLLAES